MRATTPSRHDGVDDGGHHGAGADGERDRREQGVRRHDDGDGDAVRQPVSGDVLTTSYTTRIFADKNVGTGKTVSVTGISITGTDAGNYTFNTTASTTADITARALTVSATGINKVYDRTTAATVTLSDNRVGGDVLTTATRVRRSRTRTSGPARR